MSPKIPKDATDAFKAGGANALHNAEAKSKPVNLEHEQIVRLVREGKLDDARKQIDALTTEPQVPTFIRAELPDLSKPPPKREWLAFDRRTRRKFLRMAKAFMLASDGGVGKSFFWLQLAVCLALGLPLFGTFAFEKTGHTALFMGEDDLQECHDRIYRICNALGLSAEQRETVRRLVHLYPLMGQEISLLMLDPDGNAIRTPVFHELVEHLCTEAETGGFEYIFVGFDPLARFAADAETSNALATAFVQGLEAIIASVPGRPALGCTHHSSKFSNRTGEVDARGVTGTRNAFRAELKLLKVATESGLRGILLTNSKNNHAPEADDLWLIQMQDEQMAGGGFIHVGGVLACATPEQADELQATRGSRKGTTPAQRKEAKQSGVKTEFGQNCDDVLSVLPVEPQSVNADAITAALKARGRSLSHNTIRGVLTHLATSDGGNRAVDLSDGTRGKERQWARTERSENV